MGLMGQGLAMFDVFGIMEDDKKDKKKKNKSALIEGETMNMNESFLK